MLFSGRACVVVFCPDRIALAETPARRDETAETHSTRPDRRGESATRGPAFSPGRVPLTGVPFVCGMADDFLKRRSRICCVSTACREAGARFVCPPHLPSSDGDLPGTADQHIKEPKFKDRKVSRSNDVGTSDPSNTGSTSVSSPTAQFPARTYYAPPQRSNASEFSPDHKIRTGGNVR